jgi:hypothetical protein
MDRKIDASVVVISMSGATIAVCLALLMTM